MKNLFILTVFALIALTSCNKDYTCECKYYVDGEIIVSSSETINDTYSNAADECDEDDISGTDEYFDGVEYTYVNECEIK
jgi:hypothetical protein